MTSAADLRDDLVAQIDDTGFGAHGLHVRVGDDVATHRWSPDVREEIHSVAKAVAVLAAGIAADEQLVSLDAPVSELLPTAGDVTLRHLLTMTSGVDFPYPRR
jgi:CubicO group peptidase (beta-lactamase class C family)